MAEVKVTVKNTVQGQQEVQKNAKTFAGMNKTINTVAASFGALTAAGLVFKKSFDMSREGASLNQLEKSFNRLNDEVLHTPSLLDDMSRAARGTIKETDLMAGVMTLVAGQSEEMAQQFASASPRLLEIAKAAQALNPTLGDTSFLYESIATGIKRSSPLILDNLGIVVKVGEANEKYATQLGKSVNQLTAQEKQMALLNATLEAGDTLIQQVGGDVSSQTDSWDRLTVKTSEFTDSIKQQMADGLNPWISLVTGEYHDAIRQIESDNIAAAEATNDYTEAQTRTEQGRREAIASAARTSATYDEFVKKLRELGEVGEIISPQQASITRGWYDQEKAAIVNAAAQDELNEKMERHAQLLQSNMQETEQASAAGVDYSYTLALINDAIVRPSEFNAYNDALEDNADRLELAAERAALLREELKRIEDAQKAEFINTFTTALDDQNNAYGRWVTTATAVGVLTDEQRANFEDLSSEAEKIRKNINSLQGGTAGLGLTEDELNDKLATQYERLALVEGAMGPLADQTVTYSDVSKQWVVDADAMNQALFDQIAATSDNEFAIVAAAGALGLYDEAQIEAALNAAIINEKINELAASFVNGEIDARQLQEQMESIVQGSPYTSEINVLTAEAKNSIKDVKGALDELDGRTVTSKVRVETENVGSPSGSASSGSSEPGRAVGGPVMANQPYYVHKNEVFIPPTAGNIMSGNQMNSGGNSYSITINMKGNGADRNIGKKIATTVIEELGRIT